MKVEKVTIEVAKSLFKTYLAILEPFFPKTKAPRQPAKR